MGTQGCRVFGTSGRIVNFAISPFFGASVFAETTLITSVVGWRLVADQSKIICKVGCWDNEMMEWLMNVLYHHCNKG